MTEPLLIEYTWNEHAHDLKDINPRHVGNQMQEIAKRDGRLTPQALLDANRAPGTPLHDYYEWDDAVAGELHRITQSYYVIRQHRVIYADTKREELLPPQRTMVSMRALDTDHDTGDYIPIKTAMTDQELRESYLRTAFKTLLRYREQYAAIQEFADIFAAIDAKRSQFD